ncbi:hypothetical protein L218DRAFT_274457 [Marasmius fiardii PR-910]|nr:hypothetical protein L218DRAFT_274457 [Marasmius fiardii PR-910]
MAIGSWSRWVMQHQIERQSAGRRSHSTLTSQNNCTPSRSSQDQTKHSAEPDPCPPQSIINSPEFVEPEPGPDYQRMDSPVPSNMAGKSYFSRAYNWIREFNSLPWVAAGPITVEYDATSKLSLTREPSQQPLLTWENKHLKRALKRTPEVDLTAGESPPVSSLRHLSSTCRQGSTPDNCYYANENGQIWPVVVTSPETTPPSFSERESPSSNNPPHANGILLPVTPPPRHISPDGTWRAKESMPSLSCINHTPSPAHIKVTDVEVTTSIPRNAEDLDYAAGSDTMEDHVDVSLFRRWRILQSLVVAGPQQGYFHRVVIPS